MMQMLGSGADGDKSLWSTDETLGKVTQKWQFRLHNN